MGEVSRLQRRIMRLRARSLGPRLHSALLGLYVSALRRVASVAVAHDPLPRNVARWLHRRGVPQRAVMVLSLASPFLLYLVPLASAGACVAAFLWWPLSLG